MKFAMTGQEKGVLLRQVTA